MVACGGAFLGGFGGGPETKVIRPTRGEIQESFREPGRTRLENTWAISMQVSARIGRIEVEPGDSVRKGQVLTEVDRVPFEVRVRRAEASVETLRARLAVLDDTTLEETTFEEAEARVRSSRQAVMAAMARVAAQNNKVEFATRELERRRDLAQDGTIAPTELDDFQLAADTAGETLSQFEAALAGERENLQANILGSQRARETIVRKQIERRENLAQIASAEADLESARHDLDLARVVSPIDGVVLMRYERGERPMARGDKLILLGDPSAIEVICDVLTEDALKLHSGAEAILESLGSGVRLTGRVTRIEPQGFTKLSSLGVEQQRVNVIASIDDPPANLGVGFRLHARFITGAKTNALIVPRFAVLQAPDQSYYVFVVESGRLARRPIRLGLRSDLEIEVVEGLNEDSLVVATPDSTLKAGARVTAVEGG